MTGGMFGAVAGSGVIAPALTALFVVCAEGEDELALVVKNEGAVVELFCAAAIFSDWLADEICDEVSLVGTAGFFAELKNK